MKRRPRWGIPIAWTTMNTETSSPAKVPLGPGPKGGIGLVPATALGVGGMMGAGLYTLVGQATTTAGRWLPLAFLIGAIAAVFSVYSYSKLGAKYPSRGGAAQFLVVGFGNTTTAGGLNVFQYLAYLIATALYGAGFSEYVAAIAGDGFPSWGKRLVAVAVVLFFVLINLISAGLVSKAESGIIALELVIIAAFVVLGSSKASPALLDEPSGSWTGVIVAAAVLYVTYQGFGVITNASGSMAKPKRELPRAMFLALGIVTLVYLSVSTLVVMLVPVKQIVRDSGHALADAGEAILGRPGFVIIAAAALLATASAVNATLFASANVADDVAENAEISRALTKTVWHNGTVALLVSGAIVALLVVAFPLSIVGQMASLGFLLVYGAVSVGHLRVRQHTGAKAWPLYSAIGVNAVLFVMLFINAARQSPASAVVMVAALVGSFAFEAWYRRGDRHQAPAPKVSTT